MGASVYQLALGADFARLQPELQQYFSLTASARYDGGAEASGFGSGIFDVAGCPVPALRPLIGLTSRNEALFPEYQRNVPFTIENRPSLNAHGQPALTAIRTLHFNNKTRIMEDRTCWDGEHGEHGEHGKPVGALGRTGRLLTDVTCSVGPDGRMRLASRSIRISAGRLDIKLPLLLDAGALPSSGGIKLTAASRYGRKSSSASLEPCSNTPGPSPIAFRAEGTSDR